jgi:methylenetetrahydrofolate reductase (NADPH)
MDSAVRYELLPFPSALTEAAAVSGPLALTVTCSPKQGPDNALTVGADLRQLGHRVSVHLAARMVRGAEHLDELLGRAQAAGIDDLFVIGGDVSDAAGPYRTGLALLEAIHDHANAPRLLGVPAYPEGHPQIPQRVLLDDLRAKRQIADYMVTQMCFDSARLTRWLEQMRSAGIDLPVYFGIPGLVDRRRLLEVSIRIGVGPSLAYLRKNRRIVGLFGLGKHLAETMLSELSGTVGGPLNVAGLHFFTFNRLRDTVALTQRHAQVALGTFTS